MLGYPEVNSWALAIKEAKIRSDAKWRLDARLTGGLEARLGY